MGAGCLVSRNNEQRKEQGAKAAERGGHLATEASVTDSLGGTWLCRYRAAGAVCIFFWTSREKQSLQELLLTPSPFVIDSMHLPSRFSTFSPSTILS